MKITNVIFNYLLNTIFIIGWSIFYTYIVFVLFNNIIPGKLNNTGKLGINFYLCMIWCLGIFVSYSFIFTKYVKEIFVKNVSIQFKSLIIFRCIFLAMIMYLTLVFATIISETLNISQTDTAFWYTMGL